MGESFLPRHRPAAITLCALALITVALTVIAGCQSSSQVVLPFTGLGDPAGVAVDSAGNLYVIDEWNNRVLKLTPGSSAQMVLPFTELHDPGDVAVDAFGNLYVSEPGGVLKLPVGSSDQEGLPFTGVRQSRGVAVDSAGNLYLVVFMGEYRGPTGRYCVLKLPAS
jgi:DNA-binding beta-propeller fold protein YncE